MSKQIITSDELLGLSREARKLLKCVAYELLGLCLLFELLGHIVASLIDVLLDCTPDLLVLLEVEEVVLVHVDELC